MCTRRDHTLSLVNALAPAWKQAQWRTTRYAKLEPHINVVALVTRRHRPATGTACVASECIAHVQFNGGSRRLLRGGVQQSSCVTFLVFAGSNRHEMTGDVMHVADARSRSKPGERWVAECACSGRQFGEVL